MARFRGLLYTLAKLMGDCRQKRQGRSTGGTPGDREGDRQGHEEVVQVDGFHGEVGILRSLN